jgi:threonine aldolase
MYSFKNDYSEGAHPLILEAIQKSNFVQTEGYGLDEYCESAREIIKKRIGCEDVDIHFFVGGTQTNLTFLSSILKPYEAVISANSGHILVHETGAIEATGHKILSVDVEDGKIDSSHVQRVIDDHTDEHMVMPKAVYISNPTEWGTIYSKSELESIRKCCDKNNLYLFIDGARLGAALTSKDNDIIIEDLASIADAFYIGATKNGALFGEALVISNDNFKSNFRFSMKQKGALLAKGRLLGIQFLELFKDNLFFDLAKQSNDMADLLRESISKMGYEFLVVSPTNQLFPILPNDIIAELEKKYAFYVWSKIDEKHSSIRLITSWATSEEAVEGFIKDLKKLVSALIKK